MNPREAGFRMPAEWAPHASTWVAWPSHEDLWLENLGPAREAFGQLVAAIAEGEFVDVLVLDEAGEDAARRVLAGDCVRYHRVPFGDIWLRDTAPIFLAGPRGETAAARFAFNGWGGKYLLDHDDELAERIARRVDVNRRFTMAFVLEGGAVDVDGEGTVLTTRQCLLHPNRNPSMDERQIERGVADALGAEKVLWLGDGLLNDHTDGHVDTVARFAAPGLVVAMEPRSDDDPNRDALRALLAEIGSMVDARGRRLELAPVPSPGRVVDKRGRVLPASYVNFYLANAAVVVPTYGSPFDGEAVERIGALFPGRRAVGVDARAILSGGGAFHCITQQQPKGGGAS
ncbi:MAG TPA: agmatine deiminase family protein [Polyangiaceae bacterium]|jgi:agmatine deiminase|nr:agmatine deiminase family protein [Polyangiaceae bacterium]